MKKWLEKYPLISICIFVAIMLLPNLDVVNVTIMEARNFITAREMIMDNHWLLTTMNGEPRYQKPPLPTWITALSSLLFGIKNIFGLRLPTVLMIMIIGSYIYKLSFKILENSTHSFYNALIVITSFYVIGITIEAPWDIFTHGFMLIAIYHLYLLFHKTKPSWKDALISGVFIGLSFMSKGPVSIYALLLPFLLAYGFVYRYSNFRTKSPLYITIMTLAIIIGGWWFIYVRFEDPITFNSIAQKETTNWSNYNVKPFYYYWSFFTQSGIWTIPAFISLLYPYLKNNVSHKKAYTFSFLWTIFAVILLSIIPEKKSRYLMPVLIPLAINIGFYIKYLIEKFKDLKKKRETIPVYFNFGLIAMLGIIFPVIGYYYLRTNISNSWTPFILASIVLFTLGLSILYFLILKNIRLVFLLTIGFFASIMITVMPIYKSLSSTNYKPISKLYRETSTNQLNVYSFDYVSPEMIWQFGAKLPPLKLKNGSLNYPKENTFGVLTNVKDLKNDKQLSSHFNISIISTFDLNVVNPDSKKYNKRLVNYYYIFNKKP